MTEKKQHKKKRYGCLAPVLLVAFILIIIVILGSGDSKTKQGNQVSKPTTNNPITYQIGQDVKVGEIKWNLIKARDRGQVLRASESRYPSIAKDKTSSGKFIEITMEVENLSNEMKTVSNLQLIDNKNREFINATDAMEWTPENKELFLLSNLNPNMPQQFVDIYEVPNDAIGFKVLVGDLSLWNTEEALIDLGF